MTVLQGAALFFAAILAGALNSVAGGGSFITFPTLLLTGVPAIPANATNAAALTPGSIASIAPYRSDLAHKKRELLYFSVVSAIGGVLGALVLSKTPSHIFQQMIPFLLLGATAIFAFGSRISRLVRGMRGATAPTQIADGATRGATRGELTVVMALQFVFALYGGFFGGGIGIMMLAGFSLLGMTDVHAMNALKVVLASVINGVAVIAFALLHLIWWPQAILMAVGAIAGGFGGATLAHWIPATALRYFVIAVGVALSIYFFIAYFILT